MLKLQITDQVLQIRRIVMIVLLFFVFSFFFPVNRYAEDAKEAAKEDAQEGAKPDKKEEPMIVNGDTVEYLMEGKQVSAVGNVSITSGRAKLTCEKITVNTQTKEGQAEGNVRLEDEKGIITGEKIQYNFQTKRGIIVDAGFRANPFFGRAENLEKLNEDQFIARRGYLTTCNFDKPHWRLKSKRMDVFPQSKVQTKGDSLYLGKVPVLYIPQFNKSLEDPLMNVELMPGKRKDWGPYILSAWRYNLTEDIKARIYVDYRTNFGIAEGFGTNYSSSQFGKGDFKYYYTQERDKSKDVNQDDVNAPKVFERYLIRWRHQADIGEQTKLIGEFYKIKDAKMQLYPGSDFNFLKDYFYREYEKQSQPQTYLLMHRNFAYSTLDFLVQGRTNDWYDPGYLEKLPEIKYSLSSYQIGETPFYFSNTSSAGNYNKKDNSTNPALIASNYPDVHVNRFDMSNKLSLPMKIAFLSVTPFVMNRETFYDKTATKASPAARTIFYTGADMSTKFYRTFSSVKTNLLGLDLTGLRHIITPTVGYTYNRTPTIPGTKLKQIDEIDTIGTSNGASLQLSNKLQTKRKDRSVDLVDFLITTNYYFKPSTVISGITDGAIVTQTADGFSDIYFQLKILPYSWLTLNGDATYTHSGSRDSGAYNHFSNVNYDIGFNFGVDRTFVVGQRYQIKGGNQITLDLDWRLNPKWKFSVYQRYNRGHDPTLGRGLREQQYTISRDLHCWVWDLTYNTQKGKGDTIYLIFRLKAFPELEFNFGQSYRAPEPGAQSQLY
ncbi:MAG: hypothetical protein PHW54_03220 [Candidatus Omnitrophica bacterium]|nr:hypothetical protein [Candidatus Omnitrophota bacterium]